jgi:putative mRNA 3-end processing factor
LVQKNKKILEFTDRGIYCPVADLYIDPWRPVKKALISHAHSDHAKPGSTHYVATHSSVAVMRQRLGDEVTIDGIKYGEELRVNGVKFSFHPAGHIIGSAQIRVEYRGEVWVVSGDYKTENDGISEAFEPIRCHHFITESTFGLPIFRWKPQSEVFAEINTWWQQNKENGIQSVLAVYALGKAQRILRHVDPQIGPIYTHGAVDNVNEIMMASGISLPETIRITPDNKSEVKNSGGLILATPGAIGGTWAKSLGTYSLGMVSGWMALRGTRRRRAADKGFVLSDHADWNALNEAIKASGAENIYVTHGYTEIFSRWLQECGYNSSVVRTGYGEEEEND